MAGDQGRVGSLRRAPARPDARPRAARHACREGGAVRRSGRGYPRRRQRPGELRRGHPREPLRSVACDAGRSQPGRGRSLGRDPLPAERRGAAYRRLSAAATPSGVGQLELPPRGPCARPHEGDLSHESPAVARCRPRVLRHAQQERGRRRGGGDQRVRVLTSRLHARGAVGATALAPHQRRAPHHYCGAYWGYGFHEDGVQSAMRVCERFGAAL
jgi:hypothetical protein